MRKTALKRAIAPLGITVLLTFACGDGDGTIRASGTIEVARVVVSAKAGGDVREIRAAEGVRVKKGDVLARLDDVVLSLRRRQAGAQLVQAENDERTAAEDFRRTTALFTSGSATRKQRDDAEARANVARAGADAARIAVALADEQLGCATIVAPLDGVVTRALVEEGELVFPGSALFLISDLSRAHLTVYLSARDLARVSVGQKAKVTIDAFDARTFDGTIVFISPEAEFTPKNVQSREDRVKLVFAVKIDIPNADEVLKPGLPADAVLDGGKAAEQ